MLTLPTILRFGLNGCIALPGKHFKKRSWTLLDSGLMVTKDVTVLA